MSKIVNKLYSNDSNCKNVLSIISECAIDCKRNITKDENNFAVNITVTSNRKKQIVFDYDTDVSF